MPEFDIGTSTTTGWYEKRLDAALKLEGLVDIASWIDKEYERIA